MTQARAVVADGGARIADAANAGHGLSSGSPLQAVSRADGGLALAQQNMDQLRLAVSHLVTGGHHMTTIRACFALLSLLVLLVACPFCGRPGGDPDTIANGTGAGSACTPCTADLEACGANLCATDADCLAIAPSGDNYCATPDAHPSHACCDVDGCVASRCWGKGSQTDPCASQRECLAGFCCATSPTFADCGGAPCCLPDTASDCAAPADAGAPGAWCPLCDGGGTMGG